mmetsp:Transcript_23518/g.50324  ORF Transcript_23518/g.50324 Transcript_23518/m.50324 type:complete len:375 (+) Transcript_23518:232-1356(+)
MPSKMKSFFRKNKSQAVVTSVKSLEGRGSESGDRSTPAVDPDGASTASHSSRSNEIYLSSSNTNDNTSGSPTSSYPHPTNSNSASCDDDDATADPSDPLTASKFMARSDEDMVRKRAVQPDDSPHSAANAASTNLRSRQGRDCQTRSREGVPIITASGSDYFSPSAVSSNANYATDGFYSKSKRTYGGKERPKVRPSAKNSAFGGAPRYDWMDIETTAAIKIQAVYRRLQTQNRLDNLGISTPGMRNRRAERQARLEARMSRHVASADVPFPFSLCGVGLLFGDSTFEDERVVDGLERKKAEKKKKAQEREDEERRKFRMKKKESQQLEEGIEVVESFEGEESEGEEEEGKAGTPERTSRRSTSMGRSKSKGRA